MADVLPAEGDELAEQLHTPDAVDLFQFSAAIWLTHRIHYDGDYTTGVEGHAGLPVHGPLQAVYLEQLARRDLEARLGTRVRIARFRFRHVAPAYVGQTLTCRGRVTSVEADRVNCEVWAEVDGQKTTVGELEAVPAG
ncbi:MAG TPA: hotdog domain-containing protein [Nocardioidaceae bacterium]|nr:hotdog domain-containing protein [Nocardioidaceae bacterium]